MNPGESTAPNTQFRPSNGVFRTGSDAVAMSLMLKSHKIFIAAVSEIHLRFGASVTDTPDPVAALPEVQIIFNPIL